MKKRSTKFLSLLLSLLMVVTILPAGTLTAQAADSRVENAISWAVSVANNNYYGYSQNWSRRNGTPDFDCSSLVSWAFHNAGFSVQGGLNTRNMRNAFVNAGFAWIQRRKFRDFRQGVTICNAAIFFSRKVSIQRFILAVGRMLVLMRIIMEFPVEPGAVNHGPAK